MAKYIGFSTIARNGPPFTLTDFDLVKQDIFNEFNTRRGERVMRPRFGTNIFDLLMNPADEITKAAIEEDARRIIKKDPRVELVNLRVKDTNDSIIIDITLKYIPNQRQESLFITYQKETGLINQPKLTSTGNEVTPN